MSKYRLYIDETGSHEYSKNDSIPRRYLGLIGVFVEAEEYERNIQPRVIELKKMFSSDPDNLTVLHRDEIVHKQGPFSVLDDETTKNSFNTKLLSLLCDTNYTLCGVVLDKKTHLERYGRAAVHPYHYCLSVLLERYTFFLGEIDSRGDVMSEARGKKEDAALRGAYSSFYQNGTFYCPSTKVQARLTSNDIKLRTKEKSAEGLELADLLVLATKFFILKEYAAIPELTDNFSKTIIENVERKFRCDPSSPGKKKGFGIKLIR